MEQDANNSTGYDILRERAFGFITDHGGTVREDDLIQFMFGASQRPDLWRTLLATVLGNDGRFIQTAGSWRMAMELNSAEIALAFVALDVETTGLRADQHRVIEIGIARYSNGRCSERYSTLLNPERRLPEYIRKLTGITDSELIAAPRFGEVAESVLELIGDYPIVGHNIGFDIAFLNAELRRITRPPVTNPTIDTVPMAMRVLGRTMRPSLDRVAHALGMPVRDKHRALADAELTAAVALQMMAVALENGDSLDRFVNQRSGGAIRPPTSTRASTLDRGHLEALPRKPGVYLMYDADGRILYVGKAKSLRDRVASYYSQPLGYTRKMDGLIEAIARIEHEETGSELVALLLESQLIRRHQPPYNRMLRNSESYPYIRFDTSNAWPRLRLAKKPARDGARYFGPFKSRTVARDAIKILSRRFRLRTCARTFKTPASYGNPCLELDLHRCDGPCVGRADADTYRGAVTEVLDLLSSPVPVLLTTLDAEIAVASENERFEEAQRLRNHRGQLLRLHVEQQALIAYDNSAPYLILQPAPKSTDIQILVVLRGRWWAQIVESADRADQIAARLATVWQRYCETGLDTIDHESVDEAAIIARWRALPAAQGFVVSFDPESGDWKAVAERATATWQRFMTPTDTHSEESADCVVARYDSHGEAFLGNAAHSEGSVSPA